MSAAQEGNKRIDGEGSHEGRAFAILFVRLRPTSAYKRGVSLTGESASRCEPTDISSPGACTVWLQGKRAPMSKENVQAICRLYDAFNSGDLVAFERGVSADIEWNEADNSLNCAGNPYRSFAAVRDGVFGPTTRDFEAFTVDLEKMIDAGEFVIGMGRYRGRSRVTGKELSAQFCHVLHLDSQGRLDRLQEYVDTLREAIVTGRAEQIDRFEEIQVVQPVM